MKKSKLGYKRYSPDVNRSYNVIPSNRITMRDVDFPVYGIDDLGYAQMMYPGVDYEFPGNQVFELPVRQTGGQRDVMYTPNPNDPRLKAYADSLALYDRYKEFYNHALNTNAGTREQVARRYPIQQDPNNPSLFHLVGTNPEVSPRYMFAQNTNNVNSNILPIAARSYVNENNAKLSPFLAEYKKPVQPVEYREVSKAVVKPKDSLIYINFPESKVKRTTRLPESIDSIKQDASGVNVYLTINGKTSIIPKKDYPSWRAENKDLYDAYTAKRAYGGEQLPMAQNGLNWRDVAPRPDISERRDATQVTRQVVSNPSSRLDPRNFSTSTIPEPYLRPNFFTPRQVQEARLNEIRRFTTPASGKIEGEGLIDVVLPVVAAPIVKAIAKPLMKIMGDIASYATTRSPLNDVWRLPPNTFRPNPEAYYRALGKGGIDDAFSSGVIRPKQLPGSPNAAPSVDNVFNSKLEGLVNRESPVLTRNFNAAEFTDDMRGLRMENRILDNDFYQARNTKHFSASGAGAATGSGDYNTTFIGNIDDLRKNAHLRDVSPTDTYFYNPGDKFNLPNEGVFITSDPKVYEKLTNAGKTVKLDANLFSDAGNANLEKYLTRDRGDVLKSFDNYLANPDNRGSLIPSLYPNKKEAFASSWNSSAAHSYDILNTLESPASLLSNFRNPIIKEQWAKLPASAQQFELKKLNDYYKNNVLTGKISKDNLLNYDLKTYQKQYKEILENLAEQSASSVDDVGTGVLDEFASGGLKQWFAEKWVDVKTGKDCGRSGKDRDGRPYPACRPSRRVNSTTPKTASEMSSSEKARFKREKTSGQRISYNHSRKQRGGQMSGSVGYDSMYNSPIAAFRYMMNPKDESKYYGEVYGTKQGPGIAAGIDYDFQKYGTQGMIRLGVDPLRGASIRAQGGKRFNPIDNRREELSYGPYGGVNLQTNDYVEYDGIGNELGYNNLRPRLIYGANAEYNRELANRGRFSIEGDLGVGIGDKYFAQGEFKPEPYGAVKATYSLPMYNKNTKKKPSSNRKPSPTTYSPRGYQLGGQMTPQGITPAFFTGMKDAAVDAFKSFMSSSDQPMQPTQPEAMDWRKMKRPAQIKYGIDQVVNLELEDKRRALENLLESTAYMENKYGEDPNAYGRKYTSSFMSIDPIALKDMFTGRGDKGRYNNAQKAQFENFKKLGLPVTQDEFDSRLREDDPVAAMAAARFRYALVPEALPNLDDSKAMYDYWLKYYNGNGVLKYQSKEKAYKTFLKGYKLALKND